MFASFARRLTSWYVVAAAVLVFGVLSAFGTLALSFYVHLINEGIDELSRSATMFAVRAGARQEPFVSAAREFQTRDRRTGVRVVATQAPPATWAESRKGQKGPLIIRPDFSKKALPSRVDPDDRRGSPPLNVIDGKVIYGDTRALRFSGSRFGFAVATVFGSHFQRVPFLDGDMFFAPDPQVVQDATIVLFVTVVLVSLGAGLLAWLAGRYITSQALRPLYDVTAALQRFAARDFTPQAIAVAGKSDFDAIALAYNAAAQQVAAAFDEQRQAETQMRQFVADAGHELRTPLTIVLGYIDLLRRRADEGDERSRLIFRSISIEGARMRTLIDNLVLLAKMEGEDRRPSEPFQLIPLLDELIDARRVLAPNVPIACQAAVDANVIGNRDEIHEAIANVVDNAIKYAPGSPITIATRAVDGNGVEIAISDRGPGIHPEDRAGIFDRFYRGATRGEVEGSGLGLAIAKRAAERAGGELSLASTSEAGTTFVLRLRTDGSPRPQPRTTTA